MDFEYYRNVNLLTDDFKTTTKPACTVRRGHRQIKQPTIHHNTNARFLSKKAGGQP
jgi:hypothetical protein